MTNDANCFALAEARYGAVRRRPDASVVFGVIMGTGVGGGLVVNDYLIKVRHGIAGEWGHNFLDESGYECYCGKKGCIESIISGTALERFYTEESRNKRRVAEIVHRADHKNDKAANQTIDQLLHFSGLAVSVVINILDPDAIVIGGGVSNIDFVFSEGPAEIQPHIFNDRFKTPILKPALGDSAGVIGAALLTI